jgi:signal transduction histidine kinase
VDDLAPQDKSITTPTMAGDPRSERAGPLARLSLKQKLPLILGALLIAVMGTLTAASFVEVRATTYRLAAERLASVTQQFGALFAASGPSLRTGMAATVSRPDLVAFARNRDPKLRAKALADLKFVSNAPEQVVGTELRDSKGNIVLTTAPGAGLDTMHVNDVLPRSEPGDAPVIGTFRLLRDTIVYPMAGAVKGSDDLYVVRWRKVTMTPRTRESLDKLLGTYGSPYLGNPGGSTWVDFRARVEAPPLDFASKAPVQRYTRNGEPYLAAFQVLPSSPWVIALDVPMSRVMAPASAFMQRYIVIALMALLVALAVGRIATRSLTLPLVQLSEAARAISSGDFSRTVRINRADELGDLGKAFATMSTEVEREVTERTAELNNALTQLKDTQESLVRRERLALLGQLASGVGHELRNPLGVMTNSVYYLKTVLNGQSTDVKEYLDILSQQIGLSEKIVGDLLDFARSKQPQRKPTSLTDVFAAQLARLGATNGVTVESSLNGKLPPVLVDAVQAGQIVLNLLANAVQAIEGPGRISVTGTHDGDRVHLEVADSGSGIPAENLEKIFEPLFTTKARGIGLGLAVSRTLARANGGDLTASNHNGGGAVFRLTLQAAS